MRIVSSDFRHQFFIVLIVAQSASESSLCSEDSTISINFFSLEDWLAILTLEFFDRLRQAVKLHHSPHCRMTTKNGSFTQLERLVTLKVNLSLGRTFRKMELHSQITDISINSKPGTGVQLKIMKGTNW